MGQARPNILLITCDQYRYPRFSYGPNGGFDEPLKQILGFREHVDISNPYAPFFPGLLRLRRGAVVLGNHTIAASACTPSRSVIYTGQYGTRTGVTQTDGLFKSGDSSNFPWLAADGIPTLGTWMRRAGYSTHYFGKWHVSNPPGHSLERYGFDDWELSYPEPHGASSNNLGVFRDVGFADAAESFLRRKGLGVDYDRLVATQERFAPEDATPNPDNLKPWFAVVSFTNPHDIATYPGVISQALPKDAPPTSITLPNGKVVTLPATQSAFGPLTVPQQGDRTPPPTAGSMQVALNPLGFPQDCANPSPTQNEDLSTKPSCQREYAYKMGIALASKLGYNLASRLTSKLGREELKAAAVAATLKSSIPFALAEDPAQASLLFLQLYGYLHAVVDTHLDRVLHALEDSGQSSNTIVIFLTDHGEYGAAHGMLMEKWHTAYEEALHVPVVVQFPDTGENTGMRHIKALTSHIDILPTVLGLAGVTEEERSKIHQELSAQSTVPPLPGVDLSPLIRGERHEVLEPDGQPREGVLFITDDEITAPLPLTEPNPHEKKSLEEFGIYDAAVKAVIEGVGGKGPVPGLRTGPVCQPNHVRCVRTMEYKLSRYFDPSGAAAQEWEMYDLRHDPNEGVNLVQVGVTPPTLRKDLPAWADPVALQARADHLAELLSKLEARNLSHPKTTSTGQS